MSLELLRESYAMTALSRQSRCVATRGTLLQFPNFRKWTLQICESPGRWTWDDSSSERYAPHKTASLTSSARGHARYCHMQAPQSVS